jgi:phosphoglycolate phosphatase
VVNGRTFGDGTALPRAVLYDWDNTLIDSWGTIAAAFNHTLAAFDKPVWSAEEAKARIRQSLRDSFPALFGDRWTEAREVYYAHFAAHHIETLRPLPGAEALVGAFAARGVYQAVVSNKTGRFLREEAAALGWTGLFGALVGSTDAIRDKPDPAAVEKALDGSGIAPGPEVWFVGDTGIDCECAHNAGLFPVLVGDADDEGLTRFPPARRFSTCQALSDLVVMPMGTISVPADADTVQRSSQ